MEAVEIVKRWGIDLEEVGKLDLGFSSIENPYEELYQIEGVGTEEYMAASTVLAFLKYYDEAKEKDEEYERTEEVREAIKAIERFRDRGVVPRKPAFLYDTDYFERIGRRLEDRNMNKAIVEFEKSEDNLSASEDFEDFEKAFIETLLGKDYESSR